MASIDVLYLVNEQLRLTRVVTGAIEAIYPAAHFIQISGAGCDHQYAVDALNGHDAQSTKQRIAFAQQGGWCGGGSSGWGGASRRWRGRGAGGAFLGGPPPGWLRLAPAAQTMFDGGRLEVHDAQSAQLARTLQQVFDASA